MFQFFDDKQLESLIHRLHWKGDGGLLSRRWQSSSTYSKTVPYTIYTKKETSRVLF